MKQKKEFFTNKMYKSLSISTLIIMILLPLTSIDLNKEKNKGISDFLLKQEKFHNKKIMFSRLLIETYQINQNYKEHNISVFPSCASAWVDYKGNNALKTNYIKLFTGKFNFVDIYSIANLTNPDYIFIEDMEMIPIFKKNENSNFFNNEYKIDIEDKYNIKFIEYKYGFYIFRFKGEVIEYTK